MLPQPISSDSGKSGFVNTSITNYTSINMSKVAKGVEGRSVQRHVERLLLRLDFNGRFSNSRQKRNVRVGILAQGGLM